MKLTPRWPLDAVVLLLGALIADQVLGAFMGRFDHPYDLEWMEGGMLAHAWRIQEGLGLYVAPNPDFIPYIYPPGYPTLLAGLGAIFGLEYPLGRLLSVFGTLSAAVAIPFIAWRQLGQWPIGLAGAALFLGMFRASGGFYDLVRPDALGLACVAWSVALAMERRPGTEIASGLLLCAAFLFKHNFALFGVPLLAGLLLRGPWPVAARFVAASAGPALLATLYVQVVSGGHFLTYLLEVPRSHPMLWERGLHGVPGELGAWLLPAAVVAAGWMVWRGQEGRKGWEWVFILLPGILGGAALYRLDPIRGMDMGDAWVPAVVGASVLVGLGTAVAYALRAAVTRSWEPSWRVVMGVGVAGVALLLAVLMRAHFGGFINVLMPAHWVLVLALVAVTEDLRRRFGILAVLGTVIVWLGQMDWVNNKLEVVSVVPDDTDVAAGRALEFQLAEACPEGLIFAPQFAWLPTRVGRPPSMPLIALWDVDHKGGPYQRETRAMMREAMTGHHWACVLQGSGRHGVGQGLTKSYRIEATLGPPANRLRPRTGWRVRPAEILVPRSQP